MIYQFYKKEDPHNRLCNCSKGKEEEKKKNNKKTPNAQHRATTTTSQSMAIWVNSPQGSSNTHDPFQYSIISVFLQKVIYHNTNWCETCVK